MNYTKADHSLGSVFQVGREGQTFPQSSEKETSLANYYFLFI